ncbi:MAG: hypothetical protein PHC64_05880 [Candidatus Gastranaerophilales bacterium]|nr:hypothetical protein [Candidatus Gastranaerophilales bacterium]
MNIFKSFEIFLREPLSILRERIIQIVNINSALVSQSSVNVEFLDKKTQITVVNSERMYNLLQTVLYKREKKAVERLLPTREKKQMVIGQLLKRM